MIIQELRINNLFHLIDRSQGIHVPAVGVPFKIMSIGLFHVEVLLYPKDATEEIEFTKVRISDLSPIALTTDKLLALGFTVKQCYENNGEPFEVYNKDGFDVSAKNGNFYLYINIGDDFYSFHYTRIEYIHQLQNIFFDLEGEDIIKNKL